MSDTSVLIKAYCDWQIFGDVDPKEHVEALLGVFTLGEKDDDNFDLEQFAVTTHSSNGPFGLRFVEFWITTRVTIPELNDVRDVIKDRLDRMVGDTDVDVRFVERLS